MTYDPWSVFDAGTAAGSAPPPTRDPWSVFDAAGEPPPTLEAAESGSVFGDVLHGVGSVVGAPKAATDWLYRTGADVLGLPQPEEATTGQGMRTALGFDPGQDANQGYATHLVGKGIEELTNLGTDPLIPALGPLSEAAAAGNVAAKIASRGASAAFTGLMAAGTVEEAKAAHQRLLESGADPQFAEEAFGTVLHGLFTLGGAAHLGHELVGKPRSRPVVEEAPPEPIRAVTPEPQIQPFDYPFPEHEPGASVGELPTSRRPVDPGFMPDAGYGEIPPFPELGRTVDPAAERAFLRPDMEADANMETARRTRAYLEEQSRLGWRGREAPEAVEAPVPDVWPGDVPPGFEELPPARTEREILVDLIEQRQRENAARAAAERDAQAAPPPSPPADKLLEASPPTGPQEPPAAALATGEPAPAPPVAVAPAGPVPAPVPEAPPPVQGPAPSFDQFMVEQTGRIGIPDPNAMKGLRDEYLARYPNADRDQFRPGSRGGETQPAFEAPAGPPPPDADVARATAVAEAQRAVPDEQLAQELVGLADTLEKVNLNKAAVRGQFMEESGLSGLNLDKKQIIRAIRRGGDDPIYQQVRERVRVAMSERAGRPRTELPEEAPFEIDSTPRGEDRRAAPESVELERRVAQRRQELAAEHPDIREDHPLLDAFARSEEARQLAEQGRQTAESLAETDARTGLGSARSWETALDQHTGGVGSLDIGGLGWINDNLGHDAGNVFLAAAGEAMRKALGEAPGSRGFRYGGDEIGILAADRASAERVAQRAQQLFRDATYIFEQPDGKVVRYSGGRLDYGSGEGPGREAFKSADTDLYAAREQARQRGERAAAKGQRPPGLHELPAEGDQAPANRAPEGVVPAPAEPAPTPPPAATQTFADFVRSKGAPWPLKSVDPEYKALKAEYDGRRAASVDKHPDQFDEKAGSPTPEAPGPEPAPKLAAAAPAPSRPLTLDTVRSGIPGLEFQERDGAFVAPLRDGGELRVTSVGEIEVLDKAALEASLEAGGGEVPVGSYQRIGKDSLVRIAKEAPDRTVDHEGFHFVFDRALSDRERSAVLRRYGNEEEAAYAYAKWTPKTLNSWFSKMLAFARRVYRSFRPTWESVFEETRSGRAGERAAAGTAEGERFATAPRPGQRGLEGIAEDLPGEKPKPKGPEQTTMFGGEMLQPTEAKVTEGREADGPLFSQERDARARAEAASQKTIPEADKPREDALARARAGTATTEDASLLAGGDRVTRGRARELLREMGLEGKTIDSVIQSMPGERLSAEALVGRGAAKVLSANMGLKYATAPAAAPQAPAPPRPRAVPPPQRQPGSSFTIPEEKRLEAFQRQIQDKFNRVARVQAAVREQGGRVHDRTDVATAIDAFGPKVAEQLADTNRTYVDPLVKSLSTEVRGGGSVPNQPRGTLEDLGDYMSLLHAPERDAIISRRTDGQVTNGSGWGSADVATRWQELEGKYGPRDAQGKIPGLEPRADMVRSMRDEQLRVLRDGGLISAEEEKAWRDTFGENYVPLRTFEAEEGIGSGQGFDIRGKEAKSATGRSTKAENPVVFMLQQLQRAIVRAEKNKVSQRLAELIQENPDAKLWEIDAAHEKRELGKDGKVKTVRDAMADLQDLGYKVDGEQHRITIRDPLLKRALENMSAQETGAMVRVVGKATRLYSKLVTTWAPEFMFTNFARDIQTALANAGTEHGAKAAASIAKNVLPSMKAMYRVTRDPKATGKLERFAREFKEDGGSIGFYHLDDFRGLEKDLQGRVKAAGPGMLRGTQRLWNGFTGWVEDANKAVESGTRLSSYIAMREAGLSRQKAASVSRNLTVNFGKKGEAGTAVNALYAFFNANVQGTKRLLDVVRSPKGRVMAGSVVSLGFVMDQFNRAAAGDSDEDGTNDYDSIPEYVKERNLVFMRGEGQKPLLFPMPYGYNFLHVLGRQASSTLAGAVTPGQAAANLGNATANAFNPLGSEADVVQMLSPTMLDPVVQDVMNRDFTGRAIRPEGFSGAPEKPNSELYFKNISPLARDLARIANEATGGDKVTPGYISVSPETLQHYFQFASGGLGRFGSNVASSVASIAEGETPSIRNLPLARRFVYEEGGGQQGQKFRENQQELENLWQRYKTYKAERNYEGLDELPEAMLKVRAKVESIDHQVRALRRATATPGLEERINELLRKANKLVAEARAAS